MLKIDQAILDTDSVICKNIDRFDDYERGLLSQNILAQLRNCVEYVKGEPVERFDYKVKCYKIDGVSFFAV